MMNEFVPETFEAPTDICLGEWRLRKLVPEFNDDDYTAWMDNVEHIRATPGFRHRDWPSYRITMEQNRADLARHATDFDERRGFTYSVFLSDKLVGCLYIYPLPEHGAAQARSWLTKTLAAKDTSFRNGGHWLNDEWPFKRVVYAESEHVH